MELPPLDQSPRPVVAQPVRTPPRPLCVHGFAAVGVLFVGILDMLLCQVKRALQALLSEPVPLHHKVVAVEAAWEHPAGSMRRDSP